MVLYATCWLCYFLLSSVEKASEVFFGSLEFKFQISIYCSWVIKFSEGVALTWYDIEATAVLKEMLDVGIQLNTIKYKY